MMKKRSYDLTEGSILKSLLLFTVPVVFALLLQAMYGAVDLMVVGHFAATPDVSGVATGGTIMQVVNHVVTGLAMGITIIVGQKLGEKKPENAGKAIGAGIFMFIIFTVLLMLLMIFGAGFMASLMHAPEEAFTETVRYIRICGIGSVFVVAYNLLGSIFRGMGDSTTPLITVAVACVLNILADLLFVCVFGLGAAGAALATVLAQAFSVIASLFMIRRKPLPFKFSVKDIKFDKKLIGTELKLGVPVALQEFLVGFAVLVLQSIVNSIDLSSSAAMGVGEKVCVFIMLVPMAYIQSMSAFTAQNFGASRHDRARKALGWGILTSAVFGLFTFWLTFFHGELLARIFNEDPQVISRAVLYMKAYGIDCLITPIVFCFLGFYNGYGKTMFVMIQSILCAFLVKIPVGYFMSKTENTNLFRIGLAIPISSFSQVILCLGMFVILQRKLKTQFSAETL